MTRYVAMLAAMLAVMLMPVTGSAQQADARPAGLNTGALSTVQVFDDSGAETRGKLLRLDSEAIVLLIDGAERRFDTPRVKRVVKRGDSLKNGAIAGAVFGLSIGVLTSGISDCSGGCAGWRVAMAAASTAFYAAIGVGIDALIQGRTTLYEAPVKQGAGRVPPRATIRLRVTW